MTGSEELWEDTVELIFWSPVLLQDWFLNGTWMTILC